jgi:penicillin-binding protein 2
MHDALRESCNVYFMTMGERLGLEREAKWFDAYGLGRKAGIEIGESAGSYSSNTTRGVGSHEAAQQGMGQGRVTTTPLQMANAYATMLRGGVWIQPHLVIGSPVERRQLVKIDPAVLEVVKDGMRAVVTSGTAKKGIRLKMATAGKTGTAESFRPVFNEDGTPRWKIGVRDAIDPETGEKIRGDNGQIVREEGPLVPVYKTRNGRIVHDARGRPITWYVGQQESVKGDDAWFVGYAPADKPEYVIATIMEFGGHGGQAAAPIFEEAVKQLQAHGYLQPLDVPRITPQPRRTPNPSAPLGTEENPVGKIQSDDAPAIAAATGGASR